LRDIHILQVNIHATASEHESLLGMFPAYLERPLRYKLGNGIIATRHLGK